MIERKRKREKGGDLRERVKEYGNMKGRNYRGRRKGPLRMRQRKPKMV